MEWTSSLASDGVLSYHCASLIHSSKSRTVFETDLLTESTPSFLRRFMSYNLIREGGYVNISFHRYYPPIHINLEGFQILRPQIFFSTFHCKVPYFRSLVGIRLLLDLRNGFRFNQAFEPKIHIRNHVSGELMRPYELRFISLRNIDIFSLEFPRILSPDYFEEADDQFVFSDERFRDVLFIDLDYILKVRPYDASFLHILDFQLTFNVKEMEIGDLL